MDVFGSNLRLGLVYGSSGFNLNYSEAGVGVGGRGFVSKLRPLLQVQDQRGLVQKRLVDTSETKDDMRGLTKLVLMGVSGLVTGYTGTMPDHGC